MALHNSSDLLRKRGYASVDIQRDDVIEEIKRTDALLEYAVQHGMEEEAERLRAKLKMLTESF